MIYIASPNSLHFAQAKLAILAKKHVIIEKPAVTTPLEWKELVKLANEHQVYLFEAARNYQEAAFQVVKDFLSNQEILGANFTFAKYSSKLPALLAGEMPNIFSDVYAGGALMDLGSLLPLTWPLASLENPSPATIALSNYPIRLISMVKVS